MEMISQYHAPAALAPAKNGDRPAHWMGRWLSPEAVWTIWKLR